MHYARGGEQHAILKLILGAPRDHSTIAAMAHVQQHVSDLATSATQNARSMRGGGGAEYWRDFGFLAASDFDGAEDVASYVDQLIARRQALSPSVASSALIEDHHQLFMVGAGWDDQNGAFIVKACKPTPCTKAGPLSSAVPLHLQLSYEGRGSRYELTAFLAEGVSINDESMNSRVLYGVWATAPSQHKHLFSLSRLGSLGEPWRLQD